MCTPILVPERKQHPADVNARDRMTPSSSEAESFLGSTSFLWHQRFELVPGVWTPGANDIGWLAAQCQIPTDLSGQRVLDIGTTNGAMAFEAERRGADEVVAIDLYPPTRFGFSEIKGFLKSNVTFVQLSVYELEKLGQFDLIIFWGVLYHLRHPLLALDKVRLASNGTVYLETAVADWQIDSAQRDESLVAFYRRDELAGDGSNWFAPTTRALTDWCTSCGFETSLIGRWPESGASRALVKLERSPGEPEFVAMSYELPGAETPILTE